MSNKTISRSDTRRFKLGKWLVVPQSMTMTANEKTHQLSFKVFEVLLMLINAKGGAVNREELIDKIWNGHTEVGTPALNTAIWKLRLILADDDNPEPIKTLPKLGYRLLLNVDITEPEKEVGKKIHWQAILGIALFVALLIATLVIYFKNSEPFAEKSLNFKSPKLLTHFTGVEDQPVISPNGEKLAFVWQQPGQKVKIYILDLLNKKAELELVSMSEHSEFSPEWSPDGKSIAFMRIEQGSQCKVYIKNLSNYQDTFVNNCMYTGLGTHRSLSWSKSADLLVYPDKNSSNNSTALYAYNIKNGAIKQLTNPQAGVIDDQVSWANNQQEFVFVRKILSRSEIYHSDLNGNTKQIIDQNLPVYGLSWTLDDQGILFGSISNNITSVYRLDINTGKVRVFYNEPSPFNVSTIPGQENAFIYAKFAPAEYIAIYDLNAPQIPLTKYRSTGRDMHPSYSSYSNKMAFLSSRNNRFNVWLVNLDGSKANIIDVDKSIDGSFSMSQRQPLIAFLSNNENNYQDVYIYNYYNKELTEITHDNFEYEHIYWSVDGQYLLMSSNRSGNMDIWRYSLADKTMTQLTNQEGYFAQQTSSGQVYISKQDKPGIYQVNADFSEQKIIDSPNLGDLVNWEVNDSGIYYIERDEKNDKLMYYDFATTETKQLIAFNRYEVKSNKSFSLLDGNRIAITLVTDRESDIVAVYPEDAEIP